MSRKNSVFYSALMLTAVNLLLRFAGTSFQVYLSGRIGPAGIGLLQLVMSVGSLAMIAGMAGIRTATMYLTAEELGRGNRCHVTWVLSGCFLYSILFSGTVGVLLYRFAPWIAQSWIGDMRTVEAIRLFAAFLPVTCLCGVMTGYFTAANRIGTLAAVEVAEQLCSMAVTLASLSLWAGDSAPRACQCVILGSSAGSCLTLVCLCILRLREAKCPMETTPIRRRLMDAALPLALADVTKAGISTTENLMVPRRLKRNLSIQDPLAAFGLVAGMVFPIIMFPACILFALAELLIPELARCAAARSRKRISYLVRRSLKVALLYGTVFGGLIFLTGDFLCQWLYKTSDGAGFLKWYALLIPMLYCDAITDAMTKGLGQQKICVRYNILTSAMDVALLFFLLPKYGMEGYFLSFLVTHLLNFILSLRRLLSITGESVPLYIPLFTLAAAMGAIWGASQLVSPVSRSLAYLLLFGSLLTLFQVTGREDIAWLKGIISRKEALP